MDELEKIVLSGELYRTPDEDLLDKMLGHLEQVRRFNETPCTREGVAERARMAKAMFAEIGERCYIEPPLRSNWGCKHVHFGAGIYANSNLTLVDDAEIFVGDDTMFGPNVTVCTAAHPVAPELRGSSPYEFNLPIRIGRNCWIGAGAIVLPGVSIGDDSVIGAGSVVTKDVPSGVVAVGNPCRVLREIGERDRRYYAKDREIPPELLA